MNRLNKKAVSAVVATVLIIMITVAAVGIIWAAIIPMVRDSLTKGTVCNDAMSDISTVIDGGYTCIDGSNLSLQIKKGTNDKVALVGVDVLIFTDGNSETVRVNKTNAGTLLTTGKLGTGVYGNLPGNNEFKTVTLIGNATGYNYAAVTKIKVAPVITVGKTEQICEATQEVTLTKCGN